MNLPFTEKAQEAQTILSSQPIPLSVSVALKSGNILGSTYDNRLTIMPHTCDLICESMDELVQKGIRHVMTTGCPVNTRAGTALQSYNVNYVLTNSRNRLHLLRDEAISYFTRELVAYFKGSLQVSDGLAQASRFWLKLAGKDGTINSNYGYYIFYQKVSDKDDLTQYQWARKRLIHNPDTRRAIININQPYHKSDTKDFPCTVSLQFFIMDHTLCCEVFSRSTDIITGLPYDMGFFSVMTELLWADLKQTAYPDLKLGYTTMKTIFTQIYSCRNALALKILNSRISTPMAMPHILDASEVLQDIYGDKQESEFMRWVYSHARSMSTGMRS